MIKYAKVIDEETKACMVGLGTNIEYYKSLGMDEMEVEQCEWNKGWYLKGHTPEEPAPSKEAQIIELEWELKNLDYKSLRSIRAKLAGKATAEDDAYLSQLEQQAEVKRQALKELQK